MKSLAEKEIGTIVTKEKNKQMATCSTRIEEYLRKNRMPTFSQDHSKTIKKELLSITSDKISE